jgi:hypothetical protein
MWRRLNPYAYMNEAETSEKRGLFERRSCSRESNTKVKLPEIWRKEAVSIQVPLTQRRAFVNTVMNYEVL